MNHLYLDTLAHEQILKDLLPKAPMTSKGSSAVRILTTTC